MCDRQCMLCGCVCHSTRVEVERTSWLRQFSPFIFARVIRLVWQVPLILRHLLYSAHLLLLLLPPIFTLSYTRDNLAVSTVAATVSISSVLFGFKLLLYCECYSEGCWELRIGLVTKKNLKWNRNRHSILRCRNGNTKTQDTPQRPWLIS